MSTRSIFFLRWQNQLALFILAAFAALAIGAPWIAPSPPGAEPSPYRQIGRVALRIPVPPNAVSPLGTLPGGLDVFYTLVWGTRSAFRLSLTIVLFSATFGTLLGAASGYAGGTIQSVLMRLTDAFVAFPLIAGVVMFTFLLTPYGFFAAPSSMQARLSQLGLDPVILALALFTWMPYARLADGGVSQVKQHAYVHASRALGAHPMRLVFVHLLPNALASQFVYAARDVGAMVVLAASFTFIGLGRTSEWGTLLVAGRDWIISAGGNPFIYWWTYMPLTAALLLYGIAWNLLGDGLQEHFSPRGLLRPRFNVFDFGHQLAHSRSSPLLGGLLAGVLAGLALGWQVQTPPPTDLPASALRADVREDYLRATIESFSLSADVSTAYARFRSLGDQAQLDLEAVRVAPRGVNTVYIQRFRSLAEMLLLGEIQPSRTPPGQKLGPAAIACTATLLVIIGALFAADRSSRRRQRKPPA